MWESLASLETGPASNRETSRLAPEWQSADGKPVHQLMQAASISFVPLFWNVGATLPDRTCIHLLGPTERRLKRLPYHDTLVRAVVRVRASKGRVGERPLAGIEAVALGAT